MALRKPIPVEITSDGDAMSAIEAVHADGVPRLLERNGEPIALVVSPDISADSGKPAREEIQRAIAALGSWKDLGGDDADEMIERIYRWRHEAPARPPVQL